MSDKNSKELRKQIRNVCQELVPQILGSELVKAIELRLREEINARLNLIDSRQKDIQAYTVRQTSPVTIPLDKKADSV
jgi:hypothetical protein